MFPLSDTHDLVEHRPVLISTTLPPQGFADMPVGGVKNFHVVSDKTFPILFFVLFFSRVFIDSPK